MPFMKMAKVVSKAQQEEATLLCVYVSCCIEFK